MKSLGEIKKDIYDPEGRLEGFVKFCNELSARVYSLEHPVFPVMKRETGSSTANVTVRKTGF